MVKAEKNKNKILARRRRVVLRRWWWFFRLLLIVLFFIGAVWGLNYFYNSNYFKIKNIEIKGNNHYQDKEIEEQLEGVLGENIFEVDKKAVEERLMGALVWLKGVSMNKVFPDKIVIEVIERTPHIRICYKDSFYLMDMEGVVLEELVGEEKKKYKELILVKNVVDYYPEPGERIAKRNALSCGNIYAVLDKEIRENIKEARLDDNIYGDIIFLTFENKEIIFGTSEDMVQKAEILKQILRQLSKEESIYSIIDLRSTENPIIR